MIDDKFLNEEISLKLSLLYTGIIYKVSLIQYF